MTDRVSDAAIIAFPRKKPWLAWGIAGFFCAAALYFFQTVAASFGDTLWRGVPMADVLAGLILFSVFGLLALACAFLALAQTDLSIDRGAGQVIETLRIGSLRIRTTCLPLAGFSIVSITWDPGEERRNRGRQNWFSVNLCGAGHEPIFISIHRDSEAALAEGQRLARLLGLRLADARNEFPEDPASAREALRRPTAPSTRGIPLRQNDECRMNAQFSPHEGRQQ